MRRVMSFERCDGRPTGALAKAYAVHVAANILPAPQRCARSTRQTQLLTQSLASLTGP